MIQNLRVCILLQFRNLPFSLSQSPSQLSKQTKQTIVPPAQPPPHTVYGISGALHAEDAVTVVSSGTESVCSLSDTVTTSKTNSRPFPSSVVYAPQVSSSMCSLILKPLVIAGLLPEDMSDIVSPPLNDSAVTKKQTKRITEARNLMSEEYVEMLREDRRKKLKAEELKE